MQNEAFYNGTKQINLESIFVSEAGFLRLIHWYGVRKSAPDGRIDGRVRVGGKVGPLGLPSRGASGER